MMAVCGVNPIVHGGTRTWDGGGVNALWTNPTNWTGDISPVAGDDLSFPPGAARLTSTNDFSAGTTFNSISIGGAGYLLRGANLVIAGGIAATHSTGVSTVQLPVQLSASQTFTNANAGALYFAGVINLNGNEATLGVGSGEIQMSSGSITGAGNLIKTGPSVVTLATSNSYAGTTEVRAGTFVALNAFVLGATNTGTTVLTGTILRAGGGSVANPIWEPLVLAGKLVSESNGTNASVWAGGVTLSGSTASLEAGNSPLVVNGVISGAGSVTVMGSSTVTVNATNTYSGNTTNLGGNFRINGLQPQSPVFLEVGTLGGTGTVGTVTAVGNSPKTITPGTSPGRLTTSNLTLNTSTTFIAKLNGTNAGVTYDQLKVNGSVNLSNAAPVLTLGYVPAPGDSFIIIDNDGSDAITNTFNGLPESSVLSVGTNQFQISYVGGSGNDVVLRVPLTPIRTTRIWDGGGSNNRWSNPTNWVNDFSPTPGDDLIFPVGAAQTIVSNDFPADTVFHSIIVGAGGYTFQGTRVTLNAGLTATNNLGVTSFQCPILLASNQTFTATSAILATQFSLQGAIETAGKELALSGPGIWQVSAKVQGSGALTKSGSGSLNLYASNTLAGPIQILAGRVTTYDDYGLGASNAPSTVAAGATLVLANPGTLGEPVTLAGDLIAGGPGTRAMSGNLTLSTATARIQADIPLTINGVISGTGGFAMVGSNVLVLNAANSYSGTTTISNGTLLVNGNQPSTEIVLAGGTLGGSGTVGRITSVSGGVVSPGASPGVLNSSNLTLNAAATLRVELNGPAVGVGYDQLNVTGSVSLAGCALNLLTGFTPAIGAAFTIINNDLADPVVGNFNGLVSGATFTDSGMAFQINYAGGSGNDVVLTRVNPPAQLGNVTRLTNSWMQIQGLGTSNLSYTIQAATNLNPVIAWSSLGLVTANSNGVFNFTDTNAPLFPMRFYRAFSP
jgi:autotransporter-associated beta strand protein